MHKTLPLLGGISILAVVLHHATNWGLIAMIWWPHRYRDVLSPNYDQIGTPQYVSLVAINQLMMFAIPAFLFISGLFVTYAAQGPKPTLSWKVIKNRVTGLFWPYLIWSMVVFSIDYLFGERYTLGEYVRKLITGDAVPAYFFVPVLIQFYLLSPLFIRWAKYRPRLLLLISIFLQSIIIAITYFRINWEPLDFFQQTLRQMDWVFISWILYFPLGLIVGFHLKETRLWIEQHRGRLISITVLLGFLSIVEAQLLFRLTNDMGYALSVFKVTSTLYAVSFIFAFVARDFAVSPLVRYLARIGGMSYGIFLFHPKAIELTSRAVYHVFPALLSYQIVFSILVASFVVLSALLIMNAVAKSPVRKAYRFLFG